MPASYLGVVGHDHHLRPPQRIIWRSVSTRSMLLLNSPLAVMPPVLMIVWWTCTSGNIWIVRAPQSDAGF